MTDHGPDESLLEQFTRGDRAALGLDGERVFFKIDYFDRELVTGSPDPADPAQTTRVLTIMLACEY